MEKQRAPVRRARRQQRKNPITKTRREPDHQNENNEPMMKSWVISRFALRAQTTRLKQKTSLKTREKRKTDTKQAETKGTKHRETNVKTDRRKKSL